MFSAELIGRIQSTLKLEVVEVPGEKPRKSLLRLTPEQITDTPYALFEGVDGEILSAQFFHLVPNTAYPILDPGTLVLPYTQLHIVGLTSHRSLLLSQDAEERFYGEYMEDITAGAMQEQQLSEVGDPDKVTRIRRGRLSDEREDPRGFVAFQFFTKRKLIGLMSIEWVDEDEEKKQPEADKVAHAKRVKSLLRSAEKFLVSALSNPEALQLARDGGLGKVKPEDIISS